MAAGVAQKEFEKGNDLFQKGEYAKAIAVYEEILKGGEESPELYFNLGNAYYKTENIPASILNYERAKRLNPNDEDIDFNLKLSNLKVTDKIEAIPEVFFKKWWSRLSGIISTDGWAKLSIGILFISLFFFIIYTVSGNVNLKKLFFFSGILFVFSGVGSYFLGMHSMHLNYGNQEAILFSPSVYVKSSPDERSTDLFILHEGTKVKILDVVGGWKKIRIDNGSLGWIRMNEMKEI